MIFKDLSDFKFVINFEYVAMLILFVMLINMNIHMMIMVINYLQKIIDILIMSG